MTYQVIARKWRPQQFDDVVGQETITRTLKNAIRLGRIAHAYLFTGTRGVGKTSTARILAKALNCQEGSTPTPCDTCPSCREIMQGNAVDVLEIDAASNRGIGEIRELRENVQYAPSRDRFKIFIIDEVHMLTTEAFNALLKTLEEPPSHVIFILATTELNKIPQTILSRCQQFDFRIIPVEEIHQRLKMILDSESVDLSDRAISFIVKASGGSMRDAESALQKIISLGGEEISDEDVAALLGVVQQDIINEMVRAVLEQDQPAILALIDRLHEKGHDLQNFLRSYIEQLRLMTLFRVTQRTDHLVGLAEEDKDFIRDAASRLTVEDLLRHYELILKADNELRWTPFVQFHVEMAFLKLAALPGLVPVEEILAALRQTPGRPLPESISSGRTSPPGESRPSGAPTPSTPAPEKPVPTAPSGTPDFQKYIKELRSKAPQLQAFISKVQWSLDGHKLEIKVPRDSFLEKNFRLPATQDTLKGLYQKMFGQPLEIVISSIQTANTPDKSEEKKKIQAHQLKLDDRFRKDPVARVLMERISGKWIFNDKE